MKTGPLGGDLPPKSFWKTDAFHALLLFAAPTIKSLIQKYFGHWLAAYLGIDILTEDAEKVVNGIVLGLGFVGALFAWLKSNLPSWVGATAVGSIVAYLGVRVAIPTWPVQRASYFALAVGMLILGVLVFGRRVFQGLSPNEPCVAPIAGTQSLAPIVEKIEEAKADRANGTKDE